MAKAIITPDTLPIPFYTAKIVPSTTIRARLMAKAIITPDTLPIPLYTANIVPPQLSTMGKSHFQRQPCRVLGVIGQHHRYANNPHSTSGREWRTRDVPRKASNAAPDHGTRAHA